MTPLPAAPACSVCAGGPVRYIDGEWFCAIHAALAAGRAPCARCGAVPTRRFINARLCGEHAPAQPAPDPRFTAAGLRTRYERQVLNRRR